MSNLQVIDDDYGVTEKNSIPVVSSRKVAEVFHKQHDNVLRDVRGLDCSRNFFVLNFEEKNWQNNFINSTYPDRGKSYPAN